MKQPGILTIVILKKEYKEKGFEKILYKLIFEHFLSSPTSPVRDIDIQTLETQRYLTWLNHERSSPRHTTVKLKIRILKLIRRVSSYTSRESNEEKNIAGKPKMITNHFTCDN